MATNWGVNALAPDAEQALPEDLADLLLADAARIQARRGQVIITQGSPSTDVYYVISGSLRVTVFSPNGRDTILRDVMPGRILGELAAIDGQPRSVSVVALEQSVLAMLSAEQFRDFLSNVPRAGFWMAQQLTGRVRNLTERTFELATLPVTYRLQSALLRMAVEAGIDDDRSVIRQLPTHADLASRIGTHREAVTRELGMLADEGVVSQQGRTLTILSISRLRARFPVPHH